MALSSVSVVLSSLLLRRYRPHALAEAHGDDDAERPEDGEGEDGEDLEGGGGGDGAWEWRRTLWGYGAGSSGESGGRPLLGGVEMDDSGGGEGRGAGRGRGGKGAGIALKMLRPPHVQHAAAVATASARGYRKIGQ